MGLILFKNARVGECGIDGQTDITRLIEAHRNGEDGAFDGAVELLYGELRALAHRQLARLGGNPTLQTTAIVNEAYLKLRTMPGQAVSRNHFLAIAAKAMRHVVIDYARMRRAEKRGGGLAHVDLDQSTASIAAQAEEMLMIDDALSNLSRHNPRLVKIFECKFFAGLDDEETANALDMPKRTAQRDWMKARAFLSEYLSGR
jgi:RNA polymerase sigma factor (TIGR02999 family)